MRNQPFEHLYMEHAEVKDAERFVTSIKVVRLQITVLVLQT